MSFARTNWYYIIPSETIFTMYKVAINNSNEPTVLLVILRWLHVSYSRTFLGHLSSQGFRPSMRDDWESSSRFKKNIVNHLMLTILLFASNILFGTSIAYLQQHRNMWLNYRLETINHDDALRVCASSQMNCYKENDTLLQTICCRTLA